MVLGGALFALGANVALDARARRSALLADRARIRRACGVTDARGRLRGSAVGGIGNGAAWVAAMTALQERIPLRTRAR